MLIDNYPPSMSDCDSEGLAGNCGRNCEGFLNGKCESFVEVYLDGDKMKQEILCIPCAAEMKRIIGKLPRGEYTDYTPGRARQQYHCDFCGEEIKPLQPCVAFSLWTDTNPRIDGWERKFIVYEEPT